MDAMELTDRAWPVLRRLTGAHTAIYRATSGLVGHRLPGAPPILLLDHVGAKTRTLRTTPLVYVKDGPDVVVVASKGGHPRHPGGTTTSGPIQTRRSRSARSAGTSTRGSPPTTSATVSGRRRSRRTPATGATRTGPTARYRS
ncbi:MAG TPA: nitroreductase/quinone reductase family protein [Solirubrobacteraceae bacterium]